MVALTEEGALYELTYYYDPSLEMPGDVDDIPCTSSTSPYRMPLPAGVEVSSIASHADAKHFLAVTRDKRVGRHYRLLPGTRGWVGTTGCYQG